MPYSLAYITTKDGEEAAKIAKELLEQRLIACANILPTCKSLYFWDGKLCEDSESVLVTKTVSKHAEEIIKKVKELHSYENPCIIFVPITDGSQEFLSWIGAQTKISYLDKC